MRPGSHENSPQRTVFKGGRARSNTMAARTRLNADVDDDGVVPSTLLQRPLSKSTSELSSPTAPHHGRDLASELAAVGVEPSHPRPLAAGSHTGGASVPQLVERLSMAQKTHSFFNTLKTRFARSRSKERRPGRRREDGGAAVTTGGSGGGQGTSEIGRVRRDSTDYAADNSSEHSSSATPQTQSPRHRLFAMHHDSSRGSDPALARSVGEVLPGDSPRLRARGIARAQGDGKKDTALESGSVSALSASPPPLVAIVDEDQRRREACLRQHSFFQLRVHLKKGKDLVAKDTGGTSDPYVKFKVGGRLLYKSKTIYRDLNPIWDEIFTLPIEEPFIPVHIKVFDYDWGLQDDFMGSAFLDLTKLELNTQTELVLSLAEPASGAGRSSSSAAAAVAAAAAAAMSSGSGPYLGEITMTVCITPKTQEDKDQYFQRSTKLADVNRRLKSQIWSSVVTIVLVEGRKLLPMDIDGLSDPYVKFRLGSEKYKSKIVYKSLSPSWLEQFDLHLYDDQSQELEISVWDKDTRSKDDFMGKCSIDLSKLERERTHRIWQELEDGAGALFLLLTISGTTSSETISDLSSYEETPRERNVIESRYSLMRTLHNLRDVGHLTVKVFRAQGLAAADLGGKSDPFCVLELVNSRLQTQTEYKTLAPCWQKIFTFNVKDINSVLEVTVYDEDRDHKVEFLGRVAIPLLRIHNGEKKWYALKDKKLHLRAKGNCPQILLEMTVVWNPVRGIIRTLNPKEEKYMQPEIKFKRQVFLRNVMRLKAIIVWFIDIGKYISSCFEWESIPRSIVSLVLFIVLCYAFEPYMVPIALLLVFLKYYIVTSLTGGWTARDEEEEPLGEDDDDEEDKDKEEKKSLKERLQAIQEVTQTVQNSIGYIASLGESIKNTFNFTVPYLSWLAICLLAVGAAVLYLVPMRFLIMLWGVNKFARKLVRPHTVPNNELLDFLSRVPDDEALLAYRELKPHPNEHQSERRRDNRKKHKTS